MKSEKYGERRGAAFGLAGVVKGFGISCLKKYKIVIILQECLAERLKCFFIIHFSVLLKDCMDFQEKM
jgi:hypothetical protein